MSEPKEEAGPCLFPPSGNLHPECAKMHEQGYCVCTMVQCIWCDHNHPPHRECVKDKEILWSNGWKQT